MTRYDYFEKPLEIDGQDLSCRSMWKFIQTENNSTYKVENNYRLASLPLHASPQLTAGHSGETKSI